MNRFLFNGYRQLNIKYKLTYGCFFVSLSAFNEVVARTIVKEPRYLAVWNTVYGIYMYSADALLVG